MGLGKVNVLCGPPGSGKTEEILDRFVRCAKEHGHDSVLLILPTALLVSRAREQLVRARGLPGLFDPRITTFPGLAQAILDANHESVAPVSDVQRRLLMADAMRSLRAEGKLGHFAEVWDLPGFVDALCGFADELKRAAVDRIAFRSAAESLFAGDSQSAALCDIYERYQQRLADLNLFDEPGRFWWARDLLKQGKRQPLSDLRLVLVDGFSDFTTTQMQVLALLADAAEEALVTLPLEDDGARPELFDAPRATLGRLKQHLPDIQAQWVGGPPTDAASAHSTVTLVARKLFSVPVSEKLANHDQAVRILAGPGTRAEVEQIGREIKTLLIEGGRRPEELGILVRSLDEYAGPLREVFREFGIPLHVGRGEPVARRPSVQVIMDMLAVPTEGYRRADVASFVKSNFVRGDLFQPPTGEVSPDDLERVACEAHIVRGRDAWRKHLDAYRRRLAAQLSMVEEGMVDEDDEGRLRSSSELQEEIGLVERCASVFSALADALDGLVADATRREHVRRLTELIIRVGIPDLLVHGACPDDTAANVAAFAAFADVLRDLANADAYLEGEKIAFAQFAAEARDAASRVTFQPPQWPDGRVVAIEAHDARGLCFPIVFVAGLAEGVWPARRREGPFFDDAEREKLAARGVPLRTGEERQTEEAFLFAEAISSARERLYLTYPTVDAEGQPILRSHYVEEVLQLFPKDAVEEEVASLGEVIAAPGRACCPRELSERALFDLFQPSADASDPTAYDVLLEYGPGPVRNAVRAAFAERQRDSLRPLDEFDGVLDDQAITDSLRHRFGPTRFFSAGQFQSYGKCPFRFFLERVIRADRVEEPTEEVEALERGLITHVILRDFFRKWREEHGDAPFADAHLADIRERMRRVVTDRFRAWESQGRVSHRKLWELTRADVQRDLDLLIENEMENLAGEWTPSAFELSYGSGEVPPLALGEGDGRVTVRGRIDRVDVSRDDSDGRARSFRVFDYKTGTSSPPGMKDIERGADFQLPFYALAVPLALFSEEERPPTCSGWAYYRVRRPPQLKSKVADEGRAAELIEAAIQHALRYARDIRSGRFPLDPPDCGRRCDYADVCRYSPHRIEKKRADGGGRA